MNPTEIKAASTAELVALYNKLTGKSIKKFENRRIAEARTEEAVSAASPAQLAAAEGIIQPDPAMSVVTFGDGKQMTFKEPKEKAVNKMPHAGKIIGRVAGSPVRTGLPGPNSKLTGKKLYRKVDVNPRREGSAGWLSFSVISDGMTYEEFRRKGGRSVDLNWDIRHGWVEVK